MHTSKYNASFDIIKKFVLENKDDLSKATFGKFHEKHPDVKISDAAYYASRRKALGLPSYSQARKKTDKPSTTENSTKVRTPREKMYKQFFVVPKKETTKEALALLNRFIDKMNNSNYNTKFEIIEYVPRTSDATNEPIIEVREFK